MEKKREPGYSIKTFRFRLKNPPSIFNKMASEVNFVWNYANDSSIQYWDKFDKWLSYIDLCYLTRGCSKQLTINSQTIRAVIHQHATKRKLCKKRKLAWRSAKRSLRWIPFIFIGGGVRFDSDTAYYKGHAIRFWKSQEIEGTIKTGAFTQDSRGRWYVSVTCQVPRKQIIISGTAVGVDLGLKTMATLSDGTKIERDNLTVKYADTLAMAQRAGKKRQVKGIHTKIKNTRKDFNHKTTTKLVNQYSTIFVGNVSPSKLKKTRMAKSVSDAGWADFKTMLAYKAIALGVEYKEVKESFSTVTCSTCLQRTGPSGLSALGVREWTCSCGATHDRDVNAAKNILRFGHETPIKGVTMKMPTNDL